MSGSEIKYKGIIGYDDYGNLKGLGIPCFIPAISIEDWYKFHGTAVDENLQFCADSAPATTLKTDLERLATYTAIELESAAGLPPKGLVIIEGEAIEYTGLSGNTLTGCTRAKYATKQEKHFKGCPVFLGLWFIKINGGAIFAGHQKPA